MIKSENRFIRAVKDFFGVSPFPDYRIKAKDEAERTVISNTVESKDMSCDYDKIAMSDKCTFYMTGDRSVTCATCGKTERI